MLHPVPFAPQTTLHWPESVGLSAHPPAASGAYRALSERVNQLRDELASESAERRHELAQKERLADRHEALLRLLPGG
ncbi:MAG TPA: PAS domain-containing sensor histidine kinase, partial [Pseudomonadales bacterium]|nr:PAS domain-containing sensor histidine kinase [Pseudomonadales bacterium]